MRPYKTAAAIFANPVQDLVVVRCVPVFTARGVIVIATGPGDDAPLAETFHARRGDDIDTIIAFPLDRQLFVAVAIPDSVVFIRKGAARLDEFQFLLSLRRKLRDGDILRFPPETAPASILVVSVHQHDGCNGYGGNHGDCADAEERLGFGEQAF